VAVIALTYDQFLEDILIPWAPVVLIAVVGYFMWRTLRLMPRTKPQEISPKAKSPVRWSDIAGVDETKDELREVVDFLSDPKRFQRPAGNRQDPAGQGCRPRVRGQLLQPVSLLVHRDVRRAGRGAHPQAVS
jgi:hypothetical protein